ncbi:hypothetical protein [Nereida sp. MMG025]|uniref:hypothetical protein n=1 Tax=Nereida sp. MMG025 TaxID=2909981 RepID=UPI001F33F78E|nr:hypothetical protein [Nereida sp. MMG025]MCF6443330.1 hypothetical protein [Nereida sp. MMG025]
MHRLLTAALLLPLAACSGIERTLDYIEAAEDTEALISDLGDMSNTRFSEMDDLANMNATATFQGNAAVCAPMPNCTNAMVGDLQLTADFGQGSLSGKADNFLNYNTNSENVSNVQGEIIFSNGDIGFDGPNTYTADMQGSLTSGSLEVAVDGAMTGTFKGTPIAGLTGASETGAVVVNGNRFGKIIIGAEILLD